jgi:Plasmid encoded RepA protein
MAADQSIMRNVRKRPTSSTGVQAQWSDPRPGGQISWERLDQLLANAREMEERDPWTAETVGYAGRCFVQANLPHSIRNIDPIKPYTRENGKYSLQIKPDAKYGMPYGSIPRLILIWVADEVRRTKNPLLFLGDNLSKFMSDLDMVPTGGRWGTVTRLRNQMLRLFNADIRFSSADKDGAQGRLLAFQKYDLWWNRPTDARQSDLWRSEILLTTPLFEELLVHSHPVDMRVIKALRRSPMELDVYCWLTARMYSLNRPLFLAYETLRAQFGSHYGDPYSFKLNLDKALWSVRKQYPAVRVEANVRDERGKDGWRLHPSPTSVPKDKRPLIAGPSPSLEL